MSDREARALGAGSTIEVEGTEYTLSPINIQRLAEIQRAAVKYYKREYLETYSENITVLPKERQEQVLEKKLEEVARWDIDDLPPKKAYSADDVPLTAELKARLDKIYGTEKEREDEQWKALLATALDGDQISPGQVKELTGVRPFQGTANYDMWWVTGCPEGMLCFIYESLKVRHPKLRKSDVEKWPIDKQVLAVQVVNMMTAPSVGNT